MWSWWTFLPKWIWILRHRCSFSIRRVNSRSVSGIVRDMLKGCCSILRLELIKIMGGVLGESQGIRKILTMNGRRLRMWENGSISWLKILIKLCKILVQKNKLLEKILNSRIGWKWNLKTKSTQGARMINQRETRCSRPILTSLLKRQNPSCCWKQVRDYRSSDKSRINTNIKSTSETTSWKRREEGFKDKRLLIR